MNKTAGQTGIKLDFSAYRRAVRMGDFYTYRGRIQKIAGMTVEATGLTANIGDVCSIAVGPGEGVLSEVVGLKENSIQLMPYQEVEGIGFDSVIENTGQKLMIRMSDGLIGRTVDALGNPIDGGPEIEGNEWYPCLLYTSPSPRD